MAQKSETSQCDDGSDRQWHQPWDERSPDHMGWGPAAVERAPLHWTGLTTGRDWIGLIYVLGIRRGGESATARVMQLLVMQAPARGTVSTSLASRAHDAVW